MNGAEERNDIKTYSASTSIHPFIPIRKIVSNSTSNNWFLPISQVVKTLLHSPTQRE